MSGRCTAVVLLSGGSGLEPSVGRVAIRYGALTVLRIPTSKRVLGRRTVSELGRSDAPRSLFGRLEQ